MPTATGTHWICVWETISGVLFSVVSQCAYIIYTIEDVTEDMHCGSQKAVKLIAELKKKEGLIKKKRQELGKPSMIYVLKFSSICPQKDSESQSNKTN